MRIRVCAFVCVLALLGTTGCLFGFGKKRRAVSEDNPIIVPSTQIGGKIATVNHAGKFVVIVFPVGQLPRLAQTMGVYRDGLKVAEVRITGPQLDDSVVADIAAGEVRAGDSVKE
jgi:hypothetical protein